MVGSGISECFGAIIVVVVVVPVGVFGFASVGIPVEVGACSPCGRWRVWFWQDWDAGW